jgi:hypothetical protein
MANYKLIVLPAKPEHEIAAETLYVTIADDKQSLTYWVKHPREGLVSSIITQSEMKTCTFDTINQTTQPSNFLSGLLVITKDRGHTVEPTEIEETLTHLTEDEVARPLPQGAGVPAVPPPGQPLASLRAIVPIPAPEPPQATPTYRGAQPTRIVPRVDPTSAGPAPTAAHSLTATQVNTDGEARRRREQQQRQLKLAARSKRSGANRSTASKKKLNDSLSQYNNTDLDKEVSLFTQQLTTLLQQQKISIADQTTAKNHLAAMLDEFYQSKTAQEREQITKKYQAIANTMQGHPSTGMKIIGGILAAAAAVIVAVLAVIMPPSIIILAPVAAASLLGCGLFGGGFVRTGASKGFNHLIEAADALTTEPLLTL